MRDFSIQLDYAAPMMTGFCLGCTSRPRDDVASPGTAIPFTLRGGGRGPVPLTSTVQPVVIDPRHAHPGHRRHRRDLVPLHPGHGRQRSLGAHARCSRALTADGRAKLTGFPITTVMGDSGASVTRARDRSPSAARPSPTSPVMTIPGDELLDGISTELDSLGPDPDRRASGRQLPAQLPGHRRLPEGAAAPAALHHADLARRVPAGRDRPGADAARLEAQVRRREHLPGQRRRQEGPAGRRRDLERRRHVAGRADPIAADALLDGTVGDSKMLVIDNADTPQPPATVAVLVDDLIPSP